MSAGHTQPLYSQSLYILPFDHRASFVSGLFGWTGALTPESLRVFRSCPLIRPKDAQSSLQMLAIARYGCALRQGRTPFERAARSRSKNSQALSRPPKSLPPNA